MSSTCQAPGVISACLTRLTTGQAVGLMVDLESGCVSVLAVIIFMGLIARNVVRHYLDPHSGDWSLLRTHIDVYFLCLLVFEFIHGVAAMINMKWVHDGVVTCGSFCTIQGVTRNVGSAGVALVTLVIAIHTFAVIFFHWIPPKSLLIPIVVLSIIWTFLITYVCYELVIPRAPNAPFYGPTPLVYSDASPEGCWIGPTHTAERIWGQYLWMWLAAFMSILLYVPLYFCVKGNLSYRPHSRWKIRITRTSALVGGCAPLQTHAARMATRDAMCMLYYPAAYVLMVLPLSIVRFMSEEWQEEGKSFPFPPIVSGTALFSLSGVVNVVLFVTTRPNLLLFRSESPAHSAKDPASHSDGHWTTPYQIDFLSHPPLSSQSANQIELPGLRPEWDPGTIREQSWKGGRACSPSL